MAEPPEEVAELISRLGLQPHPEGGWFAETWRDQPADGGRGTGSAIYYLLPAGEASAWHRVDAVEVWHHYAGAPVDLSIAVNGREPATIRLGSSIAGGESPQAVVPRSAWQTARPVGGWALVGCTVSPAFEFAGFELAPAGTLPVVESRGAAASAAPAVTIGELARYHAWADRMLLSACRLVPAERLAEPAPGTYGTVLLTLEHVVASAAEFQSMLEPGDSSAARASIGRPQDRPEVAPEERLAGVERRLAELDSRLVALASGFAADASAPAPGGPLDRRGVVLQVVTHAIAHRAQVASALAAIGSYPPALDYVFYAVDPDVL